MAGTEEDIERWLTQRHWTIEGNRNSVRSFNEEKGASKELKATTRFQYVQVLFWLDASVKKPFLKLTKQDMIHFWKEKAHWKSVSPKREVKAFWSWLYELERGTYPEAVSWIKAKDSSSRKLPEWMLTKEDILALINGATSLRDKAILHFLYETGARASELINCRIMDVKFDQGHKVNDSKQGIVEIVPVILNGKTGQRQILIKDCLPIVKRWLNEHPNAQSPEAYLFCTNRPEDRLANPNILNQIVKRAARSAGLQKRVHPHLFRHSRATHMAQEFTEQELKIWFGWSGGSRMPAIYTHLSSADMLNKMLRVNGLVETTPTEANPLAPRRCPRCFEENRCEFQYCGKCGEPVDTKTIAEQEKITKLAFKTMDELRGELEKLRAEINSVRG